MAKVGVRIEGTETLSPASASATKSLRQLREETESLKKGAQNILQPLINLRSTIMAVGGAAGLVQGWRTMTREIGLSLDAFAKSDKAFADLQARTNETATVIRTVIGGALAGLFSPFMEEIARVGAAMKDALKPPPSDLLDPLALGIEHAKALLDGALDKFRELSQVKGRLAALGQTIGKDLESDIAKAQAYVVLQSRTLATLQKALQAQKDAADLSAASAKLSNLYASYPNQLRIGANGYSYDETGIDWGKAAGEAFVSTIRNSDLAQLWGSPSEYQGASGWQTDWSATGGPPTGTSIRDATRGSGGLEEAASINAAVAGLTQFAMTVGGLVKSAVVGLAQEFLRVVLAAKPVTDLFGRLTAAIAPSIDRIAQVLADVLTPILDAIAPVLEIVATVLEGLKPVLEFFAHIISGIVNIFASLFGTTETLTVSAGNAAGAIQDMDMAMRRVVVEGIPAVAEALAYSVALINDIWGENKTPKGKFPDPGDWESGTWTGPTSDSPSSQPGGGYTSGSNTTVMQVPDIYVYLTVEGNVIGAGGVREVGEYTARALEAYAGIGGRIHIEEALT
jgi:hypothetical protein